LFVVLYIVSGICLLVYVIMQVILVTRTLEDRWPLGDIAFGVFFFVAGQVILYGFSTQICNVVQHYLDGLFFATVCNLLAVMMVYKVIYSGIHRIWYDANLWPVLGLDHKGRSRILCWYQAEQLGSERAITRR
jgi:hypothetical protein